MFNPIAWVKNLLAEEPVFLAWLFNGGIAVLLAYVFHFSHTQEAAAATIVAAVVTCWVALKSVPFNMTALTGAAATALTALAAFGYHFTPHTIASVIAVLSFFLGLLHRSHVSPKH